VRTHCVLKILLPEHCHKTAFLSDGKYLRFEIVNKDFMSVFEHIDKFTFMCARSNHSVWYNETDADFKNHAAMANKTFRLDLTKKEQNKINKIIDEFIKKENFK
jgi:hypothetical protein